MHMHTHTHGYGLNCVTSRSILLGSVWLSWLEHCPINQKFADSIPIQDISLGCRFGPSCGVHKKRQLIDISLSHWSFSPSFSLSLPLSPSL